MRRMRNALSHMCLCLCLRVCALAFCLTTIETNKSHNANGGSWHKLSDWISIFHFTLNWNVWESKTLSIPSTIASHSDWWCLIEKLYTIHSSIVSKVMNVCCSWRRILSSLRFCVEKKFNKNRLLLTELTFVLHIHECVLYSSGNLEWELTRVKKETNRLLCL